MCSSHRLENGAIGREVDPESGPGTPEQRQRASDEMLADTRQFIDLERSTLFTVEELIFVDE